MKVIILVAGEGSRLRPYTLDRPKCLVEVNGKPLLDYQIEVLRSEGLSDIVLVKGYMASVLDRPGTRSYINPRYNETNMLWTLFCARQELNEDVIISYGDIVYSRKVLQSILASRHHISVIIDRLWEPYWRERHIHPLDDAETLRLDEHGRIAEIGQRPKDVADIQGQYIGLTKFTKSGLQVLCDTFDQAVRIGDLDGKAPEKAYMTDMLQTLVNAGHEVWPVFIDGGWVEVDTAKDLHLKITQDRLLQISRE